MILCPNLRGECISAIVGAELRTWGFSLEVKICVKCGYEKVVKMYVEFKMIEKCN